MENDVWNYVLTLNVIWFRYLRNIFFPLPSIFINLLIKIKSRTLREIRHLSHEIRWVAEFFLKDDLPVSIPKSKKTDQGVADRMFQCNI